MAKYERIVTTKAGLELLENAAYMGGSIEFTALKTGSGTYDGTEDLAAATDLKNVCQTFGVASVSRGDGNIIVRIIIDNSKLTEGYTMTELGLYALNEDTQKEELYAIILAEAGSEDYLPPGTDVPASITFEVYFDLTESIEAVTFCVAPMEGVYVPAESFNEHVEDSDVHVTPEEKESWDNKQDALVIDEELSTESDNPVANKAVAIAISEKADSVNLASHAGNTNNPHSVTASQVGLGNVPNVATNDQTPTYTAASANAALTSGEKLSVAFGKIAKAISSLISHLVNTSNPHSVTKAQVGLGNVDNTADSAKSVKYATSAGSANAVAWENVSDKPDTYTPATHSHSATVITSGTLPVERGGTGQTTAVNAANALMNALATGSSDPQDADYYICQYAGGGTTTTTYHRRPMTALWNWIKAKADTVYLGKSATAAKATQLANARTIRTNLASTSTASFDGTANVTPGVTGTLPVANGGTGATTADAARTALGAQANLGFTPVQQGGGTNQLTNKIYLGWTGSTLDVMVDETNMGSLLYSGTAKSAVLPLAKGGTGAATAAAARTNLGLGSAATQQHTTSVTSGSAALVTSGAVYTGLAGKAASSHTHAASQVTAGTLAGKVLANATAVATLTDKQVRNIYAGTTDMTAGSTALPAGDIYIFYEA